MGTLVKWGANAWCISSQRGASISFASGSLIDVEGGGLLAAYGGYNWSGNKASLNVAAGATFDLWDSGASYPVIVDALSGSGTIRDNAGQAGLTVGIDNGSGTFSGTIQQVTSLTKTGSGAETLNGANFTYSGPTTISGGRLIFNGTGSLNTNAISLANGGKLEIASCSNDAYIAAAFYSGTGNDRQVGRRCLVHVRSGQRLVQTPATISFAPGSRIDAEGGAIMAAYDGYNWSGNNASLNVASGATFDLWDSYASNPVIVDWRRAGAAPTRNPYGGPAGLTVGIDNGSGDLQRHDPAGGQPDQGRHAACRC